MTLNKTTKKAVRPFIFYITVSSIHKNPTPIVARRCQHFTVSNASNQILSNTAVNLLADDSTRKVSCWSEPQTSANYKETSSKVTMLDESKTHRVTEVKARFLVFLLQQGDKSMQRYRVSEL